VRLERDGYEVIGAPDGERAVEKALERTPDLAPSTSLRAGSRPVATTT
jgi:hypothetical protein